MLWCDEPRNANYNRLVKAPFALSHEEMMRKDGLYDVCLVLDWNITARSRNRGSAIFMHLIRPGYEPTAGCVALHPETCAAFYRICARTQRSASCDVEPASSQQKPAIKAGF